MALRFSHRRRFRFFRLVARLGGVACGLWCAGFLVYLVHVFNSTPPNPLPPADGIVVLTGGDGRISEALALLARGEAPLMLISGVAKGTYLGDFTQDDSMAATDYAGDITVGHIATTTHQNGQEAAIWAKAHNMQSLVVVTADYHMLRALLEIHKALPKVKLIAYPVRPPAMRNRLSRGTLLMLADEYSKYLAVRVGFCGVFRTFGHKNY